MRSDEIARLMVQGLNREANSKDVAFHQGVVAAWNPVTGENTIRINGTPLQNLRVLSSGAETAFAVGQTVGVLQYRTAYFVLGRISAPGHQATTATASNGHKIDGFSVPDTYTAIVSTSIQVPEWASKAMVTALANGTVNNTSGVLDNISAYIEIPGLYSINTTDAVESTYWRALYAGATGTISVTPGGTVTASLVIGAGAAWPAHSGNYVQLELSAFFTTG